MSMGMFGINRSKSLSNKLKSIFLICISSVTALCFSAFLLFLDSQLFDFKILSLSLFLFLILGCVILSEENFFSPLVFFSIIFYGYVFSGLYFSRYLNIDQAKFFSFHGNFSTDDIKDSLLVVIIGYIFFVLGYRLIPGWRFGWMRFDIILFEHDLNFIKRSLIILFLFSFSYWIYVSFRLVGGPIDLLSNMGIYLLLLEGSGVSTAPYLIAYAATSLIFLLYLKGNLKIPIYLKIIIGISFLMNVSTARLAGSVVYLLSFPLMHALHYQYKVGLKFILFLLLGSFVLVILYFYRYYSNLKYLGSAIEGDFSDIFGEHFFGMTNVGDLQSIAFSWQYIKDIGYLYGESFFDIFLLWAFKFSIVNVEEISIGVRLRELYFSHVETGAPAPGVISEMIMNFGWSGVTLGMMLLGAFVRIFSNSLKVGHSYLNLYIYTHFLFFLLLLAKVDSTHLSALIWAALPVVFLIVMLNGVVKLKNFIYLVCR
jgi:hypothetical protein